MLLPRLAALLFVAACASGVPEPPVAPDCDEIVLAHPDSGSVQPGFAMLDLSAHGDSLKAMDHAIVVGDDGRLHCFWTRGMNWIGGEGTEFGHASSADLVQWTIHPHVRLDHPRLRIDHVWAPQVIREGGLWWMYFTGVQRGETPARNRQRIFVATSGDLMDWSGSSLVLEPRHPELAWGQGTDWGDDARDQVVFRDGDSLKMLLTVRLRSGGQSLALAEREAGEWQVTQALTSIRGQVVESPFVFRSGERLGLFLNNWADGGQQLWSADTIEGPWTKDNDAFRGFAYEMIPMTGGQYLVSHVLGPGILFTRFEAEGLRFTNQVFPDCPGTADPGWRVAGDNLPDLRAARGSP